MPPTPTATVIVPAYNASGTIRKCLAALQESADDATEIIVVDDGSTDDTVAIAEQLGGRVIRSPVNGGPGAARNRGAAEARGEVLVFVDSDVVVAPDALGRARRTLAESGAAAVFGSYDTNPAAPGVVSQFRNLLHHWVHQQSRREAFTFWAGLGAIRREIFVGVGGFDEGGPAAVLEDVELGHRVCAAGHRIVLDPAMLGTHLKHWTMGSMVRADLLYRAIPWGRLLLSGSSIPRDLNLTAAQRWSVALTGVFGATLVLATRWPALLPMAGATLGGIILLNRRFYDFLARERGLAFALASIPLHLVHLACGGLGFAYAWAETRTSRKGRRGRA